MSMRRSTIPVSRSSATQPRCCRSAVWQYATPPEPPSNDRICLAFPIPKLFRSSNRSVHCSRAPILSCLTYLLSLLTRRLYLFWIVPERWFIPTLFRRLASFKVSRLKPGWERIFWFLLAPATKMIALNIFTYWIGRARSSLPLLLIQSLPIQWPALLIQTCSFCHGPAPGSGLRSGTVLSRDGTIVPVLGLPCLTGQPSGKYYAPG